MRTLGETRKHREEEKMRRYRRKEQEDKNMRRDKDTE